MTKHQCPYCDETWEESPASHPTDRDVENVRWLVHWSIYAMAAAAVILIAWSIFR